MQRLVLVGADLLGGTGGFMLCWWMTVVAYPHNVAGRPLNSWPAYVPITFESMVLIACITAIVGMLALNGLPQPYHPVFNVQAVRARLARPVFPVHRGDAIRRSISRATREFLKGLQSDGR